MPSNLLQLDNPACMPIDSGDMQTTASGRGIVRKQPVGDWKKFGALGDNKPFAVGYKGRLDIYCRCGRCGSGSRRIVAQRHRRRVLTRRGVSVGARFSEAEFKSRPHSAASGFHPVQTAFCLFTPVRKAKGISFSLLIYRNVPRRDIRDYDQSFYFF